MTTARWGQGRRLEFIEFKLTWQRTLNRSELMDYFSISPQQASADIALYQSLAPGNMEYDRSAKCYVASASYVPRLSLARAKDYLDRLRDASVNGDLLSAAYIGDLPEVDYVALPLREPTQRVLQALLDAVRRAQMLEITYQSMRDLEPVRQWVLPRAFGFDGQRWHVRAWREAHQDYADFVLTRIQRIHGQKANGSELPQDTWWDTKVDIVICPNPRLSDKQKLSVISEYRMQDAHLTLRARKAMAYYVIRALRLDYDDAAHQHAKNQPLYLANRDALTDVINAGLKTSFGTSFH